MTISLLRELVDLAYTLNFSETAERMHISTSALSKHLGSIEDELGVRLFERTRHYVRLTPEGGEFCARMKQLIADYEAATFELRNASDDMAGTLRIGFLDAAVHDLLKTCIARFKQENPHIKLLLSSSELGDVERDLRQDEIDICISIRFCNAVLPPKMEFVKLYTDTVAAVIPYNHPFASREHVSFLELLDYPIGMPAETQYPPFAALLRDMLSQSRRDADIVGTFTHVDSALLMAESGTAITFLPAHLCQYPNSAVFIPISDAALQFEVGIFYMTTNHCRGIQPFITAMTETAVGMELPPR